MSEKPNFYQTQVGRILAHGIHEHNSGMGFIVSAVNLIKSEHESGTLTNEILEKYLDIIIKGKDKSTDGIDYIYEQLKSIEENKQ